MIPGPSVLCPIDFSDSSRTALRYAAFTAMHLHARLVVLVVNDPVLVEAAELAAGAAHLAEDTIKEARRFVRETFPGTPGVGVDAQLEVVAGKPATEILRIASRSDCALVVMGSHGATGFRRLFFGSTTERVLRETTVPVLVTPGGTPGPANPEAIRSAIRRILAPVDLTAATPHQIAAARAVAETIGAHVVLLHVVEPVRSMATARPRLPKVDAERRARAERALEAWAADLAADLHAETLVAYGEPAEEIAKVADDRDVGLIVVGLHSSAVSGPRMGSVTYRVLCLARRLVLALPPEPAPAISLGEERTASASG